MDRQVGSILQHLEDDGLTDSTIVIWVTDHGDGLPRAKRELHDSGIKVPMIIRWPERLMPEGLEPGSVDERLISTVDFAPSILRMAGLEPHGFMQGVPLQSSNRKYIFASRDRIGSVEDRQRAVRDDRFKYIRSWHPDQIEGHALAYRDNMDMIREMKKLHESGQLNAEQSLWYEAPGRERLYDLSADPHELDNLADDPAFSRELERLRHVLDGWLQRTGDWSNQPEQEMVAGFVPAGERQTTNPPEAELEDCLLHLRPVDEGSSLAYRLDSGQWQIYARPVQACDYDSIEVQAVRYGWLPSLIRVAK